MAMLNNLYLDGVMTGPFWFASAHVIRVFFFSTEDKEVSDSEEGKIGRHPIWLLNDSNITLTWGNLTYLCKIIVFIGHVIHLYMVHFL